MKTFDKALEEKLKELPYTQHVHDGGYYDGTIDGFEFGADWASKSPELVNEILTKYMEWVNSLPTQQFADWENEEEGDKKKTKARIREEFIGDLNQKG